MGLTLPQNHGVTVLFGLLGTGSDTEAAHDDRDTVLHIVVRNVIGLEDLGRVGAQSHEVEIQRRVPSLLHIGDLQVSHLMVFRGESSQRQKGEGRERAWVQPHRSPSGR